MILKFIEKHGAATFTLATLFLLTSCGEAVQTTPTRRLNQLHYPHQHLFLKLS